MNPYAYTPAHHLKYKMQLVKEMPKEIIEQIRNELGDNDVTKRNILDILEKTNNMKYCSCIDHIMSELNNITCKNDNGDECVICFEIADEFVQLKCDHKFCQKCMDSVQKNSSLVCPLCRNMQIYTQSIKINEDDMKKITEYFKIHKEDYKRGYNYLPFDLIIKDIYTKIIKN